MTDPFDVVVFVTLHANTKFPGPNHQGAIDFSYDGDPDQTVPAGISPDGTIDLTAVRGPVRIKFVLTNREPLDWGHGETYEARLKFQKSANARESVWLVKGSSKPNGPFPIKAGVNEFDNFNHSSWDDYSMYVYTRNTDKTDVYSYSLAVKLLPVGASDISKCVTYRDDPQIRNGGNSITVRFLLGFVVVTSLLVGSIVGFTLSAIGRWLLMPGN